MRRTISLSSLMLLVTVFCVLAAISQSSDRIIDSGERLAVVVENHVAIVCCFLGGIVGAWRGLRTERKLVGSFVGGLTGAASGGYAGGQVISPANLGVVIAGSFLMVLCAIFVVRQSSAEVASND